MVPVGVFLALIGCVLFFVYYPAFVIFMVVLGFCCIVWLPLNFVKLLRGEIPFGYFLFILVVVGIVVGVIWFFVA